MKKTVLIRTIELLDIELKKYITDIVEKGYENDRLTYDDFRVYGNMIERTRDLLDDTKCFIIEDDDLR